MHLYNAADDGQPQSDTAAGRRARAIGTKEALADMRDVFCGNADAPGIGNLHRHVSSVSLWPLCGDQPPAGVWARALETRLPIARWNSGRFSLTETGPF